MVAMTNSGLTCAEAKRNNGGSTMIARRTFLSLSVAAFFETLSGPGWSQAYPARPVRIIVPYPPGGPNDTVARIIAAKLSERWAQAIYVENIPAGAGNVGTAVAAHAPADGYSVVIVTSSFWLNPSLYAKLQYDPVKDFAPVTIIAAAPHVLVVHPSFPANSLKEFVAIVRANPGKYSYASAGTGQSSHLAGELFKLAAGLDLVHVPFNGASPAMMSAVGGHVPIAFISLPAAVTFIKEGKLRGLAITGNARSKLLPEVPTMAEAGFGNQESIFMQGVLFPAGTAEDIVDRWYREIADVVALSEVRDRLTSLGLEPIVNTPASFAAQIKSEVARWAKVIRQARIKPVD
jgi:tripartite-type tricarboxylate transporter receptor subunit TctC